MEENDKTNTVKSIDSAEIFPTIVEWNEDDDVILKEWVDKSACFKWLHDKF